MSDTPRVDDQIVPLYYSDDYVPAEFARQLERELAAKTKEYDELKESIPTWREML